MFKYLDYLSHQHQHKIYLILRIIYMSFHGKCLHQPAFIDQPCLHRPVQLGTREPKNIGKIITNFYPLLLKKFDFLSVTIVLITDVDILNCANLFNLK